MNSDRASSHRGRWVARDTTHRTVESPAGNSERPELEDGFTDQEPRAATHAVFTNDGILFSQSRPGIPFGQYAVRAALQHAIPRFDNPDSPADAKHGNNCRANRHLVSDFQY